MMGIGPEEAGRMSLWTYGALLQTWNERHESDDDPVEPPDREKVRRNMERLRNSPLTRSVH
ncbi:MAG: hypothetical protein GC201_00985 [Alphaproteobacteria bacterium]|nr:hypothetical protein [Alphaproteobacteria bacterium]